MIRCVLAGFLILLLLVLGGGYLYLRSSLPQVEGRVTVQGLNAPVTDRARRRWSTADHRER